MSTIKNLSPDTEGLNTVLHLGYPFADHAAMNIDTPDDYLMSINVADTEGRGATVTFDLTSVTDLGALRNFVHELNEVTNQMGAEVIEALEAGRIRPRA